MAHPFTPEELVAVPNVPAPALYALCRGLVSALHGKRVPAAVTEAADQLEHDAHALHEDLVIAATRPGIDPSTSRAAHLRLSNAWSALSDWLAGWVKLPAPANTHTAAAVKAQSALFADGLQFTKLAFKAEWSESDARLASIDHHGHKATITALGGDPFLTELRAAHRADGDALDLTRAHTVAPTAHMQEHMDAVRASLREYVTAVAATVKRSKPGSDAFAAILLAPLTAIDTSPATTAPASPVVAPAAAPSA